VQKKKSVLKQPTREDLQFDNALIFIEPTITDFCFCSTYFFFSLFLWLLSYWQIATQNFLDLDDIASLDELREKLDRTCLPSGITELFQGGELFFLAIAKDQHGFPNVSLSLTIGPSLELSMCAHNIMVPISKVAHINGCSSLIHTCSDVLNILAFLKTYTEERVPAADSIHAAR
jgi:hypothetical protein